MSANEPVFSVGSLVRVRWGARSSVYPDLPLGGCTGTVCGVEDNLRLVRLSTATLAAIDDRFQERLEAGIWLPADQLEARRHECGIPFWPHGFVTADCDIDKLLQHWTNEYACLGYGEHLFDALVDFCEMTGIEAILP